MDKLRVSELTSSALAHAVKVKSFSSWLEARRKTNENSETLFEWPVWNMKNHLN